MKLDGLLSTKNFLDFLVSMLSNSKKNSSSFILAKRNVDFFLYI